MDAAFGVLKNTLLKARPSAVAEDARKQIRRDISASDWAWMISIPQSVKYVITSKREKQYKIKFLKWQRRKKTKTEKIKRK